MCIRDSAIDALEWAEAIGGQDALIARVDASFAHVRDWVAASPHFDFLARDPATVSPTALCLVVIDPWFVALAEDAQKQVIKQVLARLEEGGVAVDINAYRDAPTGLRIWGGPTVDPEDIARLLPWIDWAYEAARARRQQAA